MNNPAHLTDDTIGLIYEGLSGDDPWGKPLAQLRSILDASNLMLRIATKGTRTAEAIFAYGPKVDQDQVANWEDHLFREIFPVSPVEGETLFFQWEKILRKPKYIRYMQSYDSSWTVVHCFESSSEQECYLIGSRERGQEQFGEETAAILKTIGGHFRRALRIRRDILRYKLTADFQGEGLDRLAIGAFLMDRNQSAITLNRTAEQLVGEGNGLTMRNGHVCAADEYDDRRLQSAIRHVLSGKADRLKARALTLSQPGGKRDLGVVIQGRPSLSPVSGKPDINVMMFVRDIESASNLDFSATRDLFNFTPAEARLAAGLAKGRLLDELEAELNISHNTARAHLRSMFAKAEVSRQSQLVYLLANCVAPLGRDMPVCI